MEFENQTNTVPSFRLETDGFAHYSPQCPTLDEIVIPANSRLVLESSLILTGATQLTMNDNVTLEIQGSFSLSEGANLFVPTTPLLRFTET